MVECRDSRLAVNDVGLVSPGGQSCYDCVDYALCGLSCISICYTD